MRNKIMAMGFVVMLFLCITALPGCGLSSTERIETLASWTTTLEDLTDQLDEQIEIVESAIEEAEAMADDSSLSADEKEAVADSLATFTEKLNDLESGREEANKVLTKINEALDSIETGDDSSIADEIAVYASVLKATGAATTGTGYGLWLSLGGIGLSVISGLLGAGASSTVSSSKIADLQSTFNTVVKSVENGLTTLDDEDASTFKSALSVVQKVKSGTEEAVAEVLKETTTKT